MARGTYMRNTLEGDSCYRPTISMRRQDTIYYYMLDALGSTTELTNASETETDSCRYYAFGQTLTSSGTTANPFGFVGNLGYYNEPNLSLQYLRARWYQPSTGRFVSPDPLDRDSISYLYTDNRPTVLPDPSGLKPRCCLAGKYFKLHHPELLWAVAFYEQQWRNPITDIQDLIARCRTPGPGETIGPPQMSCGTIRNIEKKFLGDKSIPNELKMRLLARIGDDRDCANRLLDGHWSWTYAAAWIYMYEKQTGGQNLKGFMDWWNKNPGAGNPLAPVARRYYRPLWDCCAPGLLIRWKTICAGP